MDCTWAANMHLEFVSQSNPPFNRKGASVYG